MRARLSAYSMSATVHLMLALSFLQPASPALVAAAPARPRHIEVRVAPPEDETYPGLNPRPPAEDPPQFKPGRTTLTFNQTTFDISKIAERYQVLFPFLTPGLSLDLFALTPQDEFTRFLNGLGRQSRHGDKHEAGPLSLDPRTFQALVDRTWSRRDRWQAMQPLLARAERYDADAGDLPRLLRAYGEQNMGQYYVDRNSLVRDSRVWTELALAADHVSLISFIRQYASRHPSTRGTTELLFILDKVVEGNRNILATVESTIPEAHLNDTRATAPDAYQVFLRIQRYYAKVLADRRLETPADVSTVYDGVRLKVLSGVLETTPEGYRASDARFLIGSIHWRSGHTRDALGAWCAMSPDPSDGYATSATQLLTAFAASSSTTASPCRGGPASVALSRTIDGILTQEDSRSWNFQFDRLNQFGYALDSF